MRNSVELKQERASLKDKQHALVNKAKAEKREMSEAENTSFDAYLEQRGALDKQITRQEQIEVDEKRAAVTADPVVANTTVPAKKERFSLLRALSELASGKPLTGRSAEVNDACLEEMRTQGLPLPEGNIIAIGTQQRAQTVSDDSGAKGGVLVASTPQMQNPLQPILDIASLGVNVMSGLVGDVPLPTSGSFTFGFVGETAAVSGSDVNFSGPTLKPKRVAGVVDISNKLLLQTSFNVEAYITNMINIAFGNAISTAAINGAGGDAPTGLCSLITTNINTTATALTHDIAVDLEGLIDAADATSFNRGYLSDTKVRATAKVTKVDAGSGIFLTDGKELNGYPYQTTTLMPTFDSGVSHPLIFGDWNQLTVGYWGPIVIKVDPYTQAASGKVRLIIEGFADVQVVNEKAFAINKKLTV